MHLSNGNNALNLVTIEMQGKENNKRMNEDCDDHHNVIKKKKNNNGDSVPTYYSNENVILKLYEEVNNLKRKLDVQLELYTNLEKNYFKSVEKNVELEKMVKDLTDKTSNNSNTPKKTQSRYWTKEEHEKFIEALRLFGKKDVKSISNYVGSRNATQVRTHAQKWFLKQKRESERKSIQKEREMVQKEEQLQMQWMKLKNSSSSTSPQSPPQSSGVSPNSYTVENKNVNVQPNNYIKQPENNLMPRNERLINYYNNQNFDYFMPPNRRENVGNSSPLPSPNWDEYDKNYPYYNNNLGFTSLVDSNSLQTMTASITNDKIKNQNALEQLSKPYVDDDDVELTEINSQKINNKRSHILSEVIGGPVSISPQIYSTPSPLFPSPF